MRHTVVTVLKLALVGGLIYWLSSSGRLDFLALRVFVQKPLILVGAVALWTIGFSLLGALRWFALLRGLDLEIPFWRVVRFQLIGFFFNTAVPGAVGGDIVKAVYVVREQQQQRKTPALVTVLLDRVVGLACLFFLAGFAVLADRSKFLDNPVMAPLAVFVGAGSAGFLLLAVVVFFPHKEGRDPIAWLLALGLPGSALLRKIYEALRLYRHRPGALVVAFLLSCVIQTAACLFMLVVTRELTGQNPDLTSFVTIYAVGIMATALPLAPGGLGVGHLAFDRLFQLVGMTGGATVFNVTVLAQLSLNLLGVFPYLAHRSAKTTLGQDLADVQSLSETGSSSGP